MATTNSLLLALLAVGLGTMFLVGAGFKAVLAKFQVEPPPDHRPEIDALRRHIDLVEAEQKRAEEAAILATKDALESRERYGEANAHAQQQEVEAAHQKALAEGLRQAAEDLRAQLAEAVPLAALGVPVPREVAPPPIEPPPPPPMEEHSLYLKGGIHDPDVRHEVLTSTRTGPPDEFAYGGVTYVRTGVMADAAHIYVAKHL